MAKHNVTVQVVFLVEAEDKAAAKAKVVDIDFQKSVNVDGSVEVDYVDYDFDVEECEEEN